MKITTVQIAAAVFSVSTISVAYAQQGSVLDSMAHPTSPNFDSPFPASIIPLDATLSWKDRFNGDETFNENETLGQNVIMTGMAKMDHSGVGDSVISTNVNGMQMDAAGVIQQVKAEQNKVKIKHGPIDRLGMPAMTMVFKVDDVTLLDNLEKGETVGFSVDNSSGGFVITHIMPMPTDGADSVAMNTEETEKDALTGGMDARGIVKTIQSEQGKVKIEHGPIDRLGMPAMTMVFKVENPAQLDGLVKGSSVDFSVDNSSGGFVITNIKPTDQE